MVLAFQVWSASRIKKGAVIIKEEKNLVDNLLIKASAKLAISGATIVLEKNGTPIDEDELLIHYQEEIFIVLEKNEVWRKIETTGNTIEMKENLPSNTDHKVPEIHNFTEDNESHGNNSLNDETQEDINDETSSSSSNTSQNLHNDWTDFKIPWETFDKDLLRLLESGKNTKLIIKRTVNKIIDSMRNINNRIPVSAMKRVAIALRDKYPNTFEDRSKDGARQGEGIANVMSVMKNRNNYLNRPHMNADSLSTVLEIPLKKRKSLQCIKSGCTDWQPDTYNEGITQEIAEEQRQFLLKHGEFDLQNDETIEQITSAITSSYPLQRLFLNNINKLPTVVDIQETWPCLLKQCYMMLHFSLLTDRQVNDIFKRIEEDVPKLLAYGQLKKFIDPSKAKTEDQKMILAIKTIFQHFKEEYQKLFVTVDVRN